MTKLTSEDEYYKRQMILGEIGKSGQQKLKSSNVVVIGAGGLGSPLLTYLATAGVGKITIYDHDTVSESNLHRQIIFDPKDIGLNKALVTKNKLSIKNPYIKISAVTKKFDKNEDISEFDMIIDCTDNFNAKFSAHDLAYKFNKKFCVASIHKFEGQIQLFDFTKNDEAPCMRCLWEQKPSNDCVQTCEEAGVIGAVAGVLGTIGAMEIIKSLLGLNTLQNKQNLIINLLDFSSFKLRLSKNIDCPLCGSGIIEDQTSEFEISLDQAQNGNYTVVNISSQTAVESCSINSSIDQILKDLYHLPPNEKIAILCNRGITSIKATKLLRENGFSNSFSIIGGLESI
jgi:adenylyltransferase/sulfurtransferase